jgi:hypothetical protein
MTKNINKTFLRTDRKVVENSWRLTDKKSEQEYPNNEKMLNYSI